MRKLDCMIHHMLLPACAMILPSVTDLQLVDFHSIERATMDRLYKMYPNITSLKLHATNKLPYFENANVLGQFLEHMSQLDKLSISQPLPSDYPEYMLAILGWPVKTIEIDVTNAGNGYQRQAQRRLRENIMPRSIVAIRCSRGRTTDGIWLSQYTVTLQLREGRSWIFTTDNFPRAMQNFAAPFLRETQVDEVVLDGHAAFAMFYSATRGSALGHIRTIRAVVDGPDSIRVPQQDVNVRGLEKIVLETRPEHGSRISASTLAKLVSKLKTDKRPDLYLGDTFVYDDEGTHEIGQYANIVDGQVRKPSWKIVTP
ncbi:hypothetical protein BKA62DRAFT_701935 [Auriculariales sp. MPI-PUGE-AT-0066]|nr:hypothetical protein BKA62DRAFT_701935 [Auriculariales sp. MPI-PUGE-AT-0066]